MSRIFALPAMFVALSALFSTSPQSYAAVSCTYKAVPTKDAQTFTVTIPAILDAKKFSAQLAKQIYALSPSVPLYKVSADRFDDYAFVGSSSKDTEKQILVYLVKRHFVGSSGVSPDEPFHQATSALLEEMQKTGQIVSFEANPKLDPAVLPVGRATDFCVPI